MDRNAVPKTAGAVFTFMLIATLNAQQPPDDGFQGAVDAVRQHASLIVLASPDGQASIAVWPAMQGRVLTSSAEGPNGRSFGWINQDLIASGKVQPHMNAVGGEDRLWLGPEGGQFSLYFAPGAPFDLEHWYTPAPIDTEPFDVLGETPSSVSLRKVTRLANYSGTVFDIQIDREVRLLSGNRSWGYLHAVPVPGVKVVGFESVNVLTNVSKTAWSKSTGLVSLWVLGQFQVTPKTTIVLPIRQGSDAELGIPVTTDYFGPVPADRIRINSTAVFFKADAKYRSKLGLSPQRARGLIGSYDAVNHVLTIVQFSKPESALEYVNSAWKLQAEPFKGDVANCYNDGPPSPGKPQLGRFYELESSSPAQALGPHDQIEHVQRTIHLVGSPEQLGRIAQSVLGVSLEEVNAFNH